jgi:hypothetical protein
MEQHYAFIKNNRVKEISVFISQDEALADAVAQEHGFDDAVWVGETIPTLHSIYDGNTFTPPTLDYLYEINISNENTAMQEERLAKEAIAKAEADVAIAAKAEAKKQALAALGLSQEIVNLLAE